MTNQDHVTYPTAKLLKAAGYPQKACRVYDDEGDILDTFSPVTEDETAAPHLYDAMKWLREEKRTHVSIISRIGYSGLYGYETTVKACHEEVLKRRHDGIVIDLWNPDEPFLTYEQACDAGIAAACKWLLGKNHSKKA